MSRLNTLSPNALQAMFGTETNQELALLVTVYDPIDPTQVILRISDSYTQRISGLTNDDDIIYGMVSRGYTYIFLPMKIILPNEAESSASTCSITMYDVTRYLIPVIRQLNGKPKIKLELVLTGSPDTVEVSFSNLYITNFNYSVDQVTADLSMINYEIEPFPQYSFTPVHFPGLF
jgi:hypothetical protein